MADTFTIVKQDQILDTRDVTNPVQAMQVTFRTTANGTQGTVVVPLADYTPEEVQRRITAYVVNIDAVHNL